MEPDDTNFSLMSLLQDLFGVSQTTTNDIIELLKTSGEIDQVIQNIKDLEDEDDDEMYDLPPADDSNNERDGEITNPDDLDNPQLRDTYAKHDTDGWTPEKDRMSSDVDQATLPPAVSADQYEGFKPGFLSFLGENLKQSRIDSTIMNMTDDWEDDIDDITKRRIEAFEKRGNMVGAERLRTQALNRAQILNKENTKPLDPTQRLVQQRKQQLAAAITVANKQRELQAQQAQDAV